MITLLENKIELTIYCFLIQMKQRQRIITI